jgi:hypothetical protein
MNISKHSRLVLLMRGALVRNPLEEFTIMAATKLARTLVLLMLICVPVASNATDNRTGPRLYQSTLTGEIKSASAMAQTGSSAVIFTTPSTGYFVLTGTWGPVTGSTFMLAGGGSFSPGIALPQNEVLSCSPGATPWPSQVSCMITGVFQK